MRQISLFNSRNQNLAIIAVLVIALAIFVGLLARKNRNPLVGKDGGVTAPSNQTSTIQSERTIEPSSEENGSLDNTSSSSETTTSPPEGN